MIKAGNIQSWVVGKLKLSRRSDLYSPDDFFRSLQDAINYVSTKFPILVESQTFTTTAGNGIYYLTTTYRPVRIHSITFPTGWTALPIYVENQRMLDIKKSIDNGVNLQSYSSSYNVIQLFPFYLSASQPTYWTYCQDDSAPYIELQDDASISADQTITVKYGYAFPDVISDMDLEIPLPVEYKKLVTLYISKDLALTYSQYIPMFAGMYSVLEREMQMEELHLIEHRQRKMISDIRLREPVRW